MICISIAGLSNPILSNFKKRDEIEEKYKWDLTDFFKTDEEWNKEYDLAKKEVNKFKKYVGCTKDAGKLYEFLDKDIKLDARLDNLYIYAYLINDQELGISSSIERKDKIKQ